MILEIKKWCEGIIVAVILCIIIESFIPNGNNKKYIKIIIGIYIMYVTLNPILNLLNYEIDMKELFAEIDSVEVSSSMDNNIKDVYILGIEESIKNEIKELGFEIENVKVFVDINYENIEKIELEIKDIEYVNNLFGTNQITSDDKGSTQNDYNKIIDYITQNYSIEKKQIVFR